MSDNYRVCVCVCVLVWPSDKDFFARISPNDRGPSPGLFAFGNAVILVYRVTGYDNWVVLRLVGISDWECVRVCGV